MIIINPDSGPDLLPGEGFRGAWPTLFLVACDASVGLPAEESPAETPDVPLGFHPFFSFTHSFTLFLLSVLVVGRLGLSCLSTAGLFFFWSFNPTPSLTFDLVVRVLSSCSGC